MKKEYSEPRIEAYELQIESGIAASLGAEGAAGAMMYEEDGNTYQL